MKQLLIKGLDSFVGGIICYIIGLCLYNSKRTQNVPEKPSRILVIRPGGIGDMLLLLPLLTVLRKKFPNAEIHIVCEKRNVQALELADLNIRPILYNSNPFTFLATIIHTKYDIAIDTEQFHKFSAIFAFLSGAQIRVGFKIAPKRNPLYTHLINYDLIGYEADEFFKLLSCLDIKKDLFPDISNVIKIDDEESKNLIAEQGKIIVIHPSASTDYKLWHRTRFAKLLVLMHEKYSDHKIMVVGSQDERQYAVYLRDDLEAKNIDIKVFNGEFSLRETALLINRAELFIGSDSGLAHLAVLLNIPSITLFGPSDAKKWGIQSDRHKCIFSQRTCAPCFIFGYQNPCQSKACMQDIPVDEVFDAVQELIV
ncbi:MAG: glycosyltransferase family 9 protein [Kiritimatiellae bacterium]|nr:glycosyltransferase family 9 protein [Kiritimatiellia bacterium]